MSPCCCGRDPTIRAVIDTHHRCTADGATIAGLTDEIATLRPHSTRSPTRSTAITNNSDDSRHEKTETVNRPIRTNRSD